MLPSREYPSWHSGRFERSILGRVPNLSIGSLLDSYRLSGSSQKGGSLTLEVFRVVHASILEAVQGSGLVLANTSEPAVHRDSNYVDERTHAPIGRCVKPKLQAGVAGE